MAPTSTITLVVSWGNGIGAQGTNGNQAEMQLRYGGTTYATFTTSTFTSAPTTPSPGPSGGSSFTANNGAAITATGGTWTTVGSPATTFVVTLPAAVASSGALELAARRMQNGASDGATDDFYVDSLTLDTTTLCLVKVSTGGTGTFGFTGITNLDTNLITAGIQNTASSHYRGRHARSLRRRNHHLRQRPARLGADAG